MAASSLFDAANSDTGSFHALQRVMGKVLIYGANGYSGGLAARHAAEMGVDAVVAGRSRAPVEQCAASYGLPARVFGLDDPDAIDAGLSDIDVVLNCAGPFFRTAIPLAEACIRCGVHYLDITGEIGVIEAIAELDGRARDAGVTLMPATGFDVVPTDCMAAHLKSRLPDAETLELAFYGLSSLSHGTATTIIEGLSEGGAVRRDGRIVSEPAASRLITVDFGRGPKRCASIPWGDVASAYHTTGIPNIITYMAMPGASARIANLTRPLHRLAGMGWVKRIAQRSVDRKVTGPSDQERDRGMSFVWGRASNAAGHVVEARLTTLEGYTLTWQTSLTIARRVQRGEVTPGFKTPAGAFGADFILEFPPSERQDIAVN